MGLLHLVSTGLVKLGSTRSGPFSYSMECGIRADVGRKVPFGLLFTRIFVTTLIFRRDFL